MAKFIKQREFDALQAKSDEIKKEYGINSLKDEIEYAMSQPGTPVLEKLIVIPDEDWKDEYEDGLDWNGALELIRDADCRGSGELQPR